MGIENTVGKQKLLVTSTFIFPSVFKRLKLQTHENQGLFGKGLTVLLKLVFKPYVFYTFTFFSSLKRLYSTVPVNLQNVEILLKDEKAL